VEIYSALNRRVREGSLSQFDYQAIAADFEALCQFEYQLIAVTPKLITQTRTLLETYPLRAYDALHLATALEVNMLLTTSNRDPLIFLGADVRLLEAAQTAGLETTNPNLH
jgi:predicted nucleic acid-binding protein